MKPTARRLSHSAIALSATAVLLAACGGSDGGSTSSDGGDSKYADGATFTMALKGDPGKLDPQSSASSQLFTVNQLGYDNLVAVDGDTGAIESQLASDWKVDGKTRHPHPEQGRHLLRRQRLHGEDRRRQHRLRQRPEEQEPLPRRVPAGRRDRQGGRRRRNGDDHAGPARAVRAQRSGQPARWSATPASRTASSLADSTVGTGPYVLSEAAPGDHYTYQVRDGYTWGPNGATTAESGMPKTIVMKIIENEGTAANLLASGDVNAAQVIGPDAKRLDAQGLFAAETPALQGEQWYNHNDGHATSDPAVRMALTQSLDLAQLESVSTADAGTPATTLAAIEPVACPGDSVSGSLPAQDVDAAKAALAGQPELTFLYSSAAGSSVAAAAELAVQEWAAAGVKVTAKGVDETALQGAIFGTGDWDIAWVPLNVSSPDQLVPFLSGAGLADGGTNFSGIDNKDYTDGVTAASAMPGTDGCDTWLKAESSLFVAADIVPFANNIVKTFGNGAEFETPGQLVPTSIRMLAN